VTVDLTSDKTKLVLVVLVLVCGALGGLAAELMKTRRIAGIDEEGGVERPAKLTPRYTDWGAWATIILGIVAALIAMWAFDLIDQVPKGGTATGNKDQYDIWEVVGVTLVAGFSASKLLTLLQERMLALLTAEQMKERMGGTRTVLHESMATADTLDDAQKAAQVVDAVAAGKRPPSI
jgi:uncharacterized membrane protein YeaQ/YmgE (transglycosylase-associated protein family)